MEYRIVEKDKFYVQRKSRFGWLYRYDEMKNGGTSYILVICFIIINIAIITNWNSIKEFNIIIFFELLMIIAFLISRFGWKHKFSSMQGAKDFIDNEIREKEENARKRKERKIKRKNVKYHYMSVKQERKEKLNKLK